MSLFRYLGMVMLLMLSHGVWAQELSVKSIRETTDILYGHQQKLDANNVICPVIKVFLPIEGVTFEGSVVDFVYKTNEYWIYTVAGNKNLVVHCPGYHTLKVYMGTAFPRGLQSKRVYELELDGYQTGALASNYINGHEYVDLGLSVKWATCNVGADSPSDYGNYFAWGETSTKSSYTANDRKTYGNNAYNRDIGGDPSLDAARANWGGTWRLPTEAEFQELLNNCIWTWTTQGGNYGCKITSNNNGNTIFLPAAGWRYDSSLNDIGEHGSYWSSSLDGSFRVARRCLYFNSSSHNTVKRIYLFGFSVRPVSE